MARLDNKVMLVSGGARGQDAAKARLLVAQGAKVVIGDVLDNQGHALVVELGPAALMETDDALWQRHIQINQYGCSLGMKAVVPAMERSGGGAIVVISSVASLDGASESFTNAR